MKYYLTFVLLLVTSISGFAQAGKVEFTASWEKARGFASNQFAVWIEDKNGKYIKTLYATDFTKKGGYKSRPACLPLWRKASNRDQRSDKIIDSITGATPRKSGDIKLTWDLTDEAGKKVAPGLYIYKAESNLHQEARSVLTGKIIIGNKPDKSEASAEYLPSDTEKKTRGIVKLSASFNTSE